MLKRLVLILLLVLVAVSLGCGGVLVLLAWFATPLPTTQEALSSLSSQDRQAFQDLLNAAQLEPNDLRHIGGYGNGLFDHEQNHRAFVVRDGKLLAICLRDVVFSDSPDFNGLTDLEAIDLQGKSLTAWPRIERLEKLQVLNLRDQPLPNPVAETLPRSIVDLNLSGTQLDSLDSLKDLVSLKNLNVSKTNIASIDPIVDLPLDYVQASQTLITSLPAKLPSKGGWQVNLDGTSVVSPKGFHKEWPFGSWVSTAARNDVVWNGTLTKTHTDMRGLIPSVPTTQGYELPSITDPNIPDVSIAARCKSGTVRIWLQEPRDLFSSPWFTSHRIQGFGPFRKTGYVYFDVSAHQPQSAHGALRLRTESRIYEMPSATRSESTKPPDWCHYGFYLEPIGNTPVTDLELHITYPQ